MTVGEEFVLVLLSIHQRALCPACCTLNTPLLQQPRKNPAKGLWKTP
jgi:hypothetical protein